MGGGGFVGSHLAEYLLKKKYEVIIVTRKNTKNLKSICHYVKIHKINVENFLKIKEFLKKTNPDLIIHLAGNTSHSKSFENPQADLKSNAKSTLNILECIRTEIPNCKFILGSTFVVIGKPTKLPIDEKSPCNPTSLYAANRLTSEYYTKIYNEVYGLNTKIFRITNSFGPREQIIPTKNAINYLIYKAYKSELITIFNSGKFFRDLIYISDVVSAIHIIMKKGKPGETYWISSGIKTWFYEIGAILEKHTDSKTKYVKTPSYTKKVDVGNFITDNSKLKKLGWRPEVSVEDGIIQTLDYFRERKF